MNKELEDQLSGYFHETKEEIPEQTISMLFPQFNGLNDRLLTTIGIKVRNYNIYHLDVQIDIGSMRYCATFVDILEYYWKNINI
jgi:hypothetical protein